MEEKLICSVCGKTLTEEIANHFDGQIMCKDCFELKTTVCECCGERIWEEDARGNSRIILLSQHVRCIAIPAMYEAKQK